MGTPENPVPLADLLGAPLHLSDVDFVPLKDADSITSVLSVSAALAVVGLSVVVLTGYTGQISLAQMSLAGLGGWLGAKVVVASGSFELVPFVVTFTHRTSGG